MLKEHDAHPEDLNLFATIFNDSFRVSDTCAFPGHLQHAHTHTNFKMIKNKSQQKGNRKPFPSALISSPIVLSKRWCHMSFSFRCMVQQWWAQACVGLMQVTEAVESSWVQWLCHIKRTIFLKTCLKPLALQFFLYLLFHSVHWALKWWRR